MLPVAILAGGLATRMRPLTEKIPKALIDVAGEPFIFRQLAYLRGQGVTKVVLCIGYLGEQIEAEVGDGSRFGLEIVYVPDGPKLLGTGGALRRALPALGRTFFVLYGDSFLPVNFAPIEQFFAKRDKSALMTVLRNGNRWDKSNVLFENGLLVEYNKLAPRPEMEFIDYGLAIVSAEILSGYAENEVFDLAEVYYSLSIRGDLDGYEVFDRFYEIGSPTGLKEAEEYFIMKGKV